MKIPSHAKRVFKGIMFDVYQWEQELFDGSKTVFEMVKRPDTTRVIPVIDDQIYYCYTEQPGQPAFYSSFGGRVEEGESPLECAKRELLEETGMVSDDWELCLQEDPVIKMDWTIYTYIARNCRFVQDQELDAGEKIELKHANFNEFINLTQSEHYHELGFSAHVLRLMQQASGLEDFKKKLFL